MTLQDVRKRVRHRSSHALILTGKSLSLTLVTILLFSYLSLLYLTGLKTHPLDVDEYIFTQKSYFFDLFVQRKFSDWRWYYSNSSAQPKLGPYIFGITLHLAGIDNIEQELIKRGFENTKSKEHWAYRLMNKDLINPPTAILPQLELIQINRYPSVLFSLGALALTFLITLRIKGLFFAGIATLLLGTNSLMVLFGKRAMTDSMQLFFFLLTILLTSLLLNALEKKNTSRVYLLSVALGMSSAFGTGVKVSGILNVLFLMILVLFLLILLRKTKTILITLITSILIMVVTFAILFIPPHPYLYQHPIRQFTSMFTRRLVASDNYMLAFPLSAVHSRSEAINLVIKNTLFPTGNYINFRFLFIPLDLTLFSWGFLLVGNQALNDIVGKKKITGEVLLITWTLLVSISLMAYMKNNWPRFYLPTTAAVTFMEAYAISAVVREIVSMSIWRRRTKKHQPVGLSREG